jgi:membrane associated rhomboid family serine protease
MHVATDDMNVPVRPTWRSFVLSMVTGSIYQLYWIVAVGRELRALGVRVPTNPAVTVGLLACAQLTVLWVAAVAGSTAFGVLAALAALGIGAYALCELALAIRVCQLEAGLDAPADLRIVAGLFVVGCVVGAMGVLPVPGEGPGQRVIGALSTGLVLPFWLLYLQHQLNRALESIGTVSVDEELFGASNSSHAVDVMRQRIAVYQHGRERRTEQLDDQPWATWALTALCTLVFAWQVLSFGITLSLDEMRESGALTMDLVRDGQPWRLLTQHLVHFSVDHWAFNMFALCITGWIVERTIGHRRTLAAMGGAVVGATAASWFIGPLLYGPQASQVVSGGESGIGFGMIGALLAIDPRGHTQTGRFAHWLGGIGLVSSLSPGVGILAHAGGFIGSFVAVRVLYREAWELRIDEVIARSKREAATVAAAASAHPTAPAPVVLLPPTHPPAAAAPPPVLPPPMHPPAVVPPPPIPPADRRAG